MANLIAGQPADNHEHAGHALGVARAARNAAIDIALKHAEDHDVWIIDSKPTPKSLQRYHQHHATVRVCDPGKDVVMKRVKEQRPEHMTKIAAAWYDDKPKINGQPKVQAHERGYGWRHRNQKHRLLARLSDGSPCEWCGKPMHRDPAANWDEAPLEADHTKNIKHHGQDQLADRLLHRSCNRQRKDNPATTRPPGMMKLDEMDGPDLRPPAARSPVDWS